MEDGRPVSLPEIGHVARPEGHVRRRKSGSGIGEPEELGTHRDGRLLAGLVPASEIGIRRSERKTKPDRDSETKS